jgi:GTP cyclohydrolase I
MTSTLPSNPSSRQENSDSLLIPVSQRIKNRLQLQGVPFLANDNISEYLEAGELEHLEIEVAASLINDSLKSIIEGEAMELRFLPRGSRLPL